MTIVESPPDVATLFERWLAGGKPWREGAALEESLWPHRGKWLLCGDRVFWLAKFDRRDVVRVAPRWCQLRPEWGVAESNLLTTQGAVR